MVFYATLSLNWRKCHLQTIVKILRASNSDTRQRKIYSTDFFRTTGTLYQLHLVHQLSSPKLFFRCMRFRAGLEIATH